jgi:hypothetical protein
MSSIPNGGNNIYIASGAILYYYITPGNTGWQGDAVIQWQALNTEASLSTSLDSVSLGGDGHYQFNYHVRNNGPNSTYANTQLALV